MTNAAVPNVPPDTVVRPEAVVIAELSDVPVRVAAAAVTVQVEPSVQVCPFTVVAELTRPALGNPVALVSTRAEGVPSAGVTRVGEVARTFAPVPVTVEIATPLILKTLPVDAVSKVLVVRMSVVAFPMSVSVAAGSESVTEPKAPVTG